jgi:C-terminal domain of 1-Cys peroxiredoxin
MSWIESHKVSALPPRKSARAVPLQTLWLSAGVRFAASLDSLQMLAKHKVVTPANWQPADPDMRIEHELEHQAHYDGIKQLAVGEGHQVGATEG